MSNKQMTDQAFGRTLRSSTNNSLLLLEDMDVAFPSKRVKGKKEVETVQKSQLTMSGVFNALDGMLASEGKIIFITTNFKENLDEALIRPGRVDKEIRLGYATEYQIEKMCRRFLGNDREELCNTISSLLPKDTLTMAELQMLFLRYRDIYEEIPANVEQFVKDVLAERTSVQEETIDETQKNTKKEEKEGEFEGENLRKMLIEAEQLGISELSDAFRKGTLFEIARSD